MSAPDGARTAGGPPPHRTFDELAADVATWRRSRTDRKVAGVCGGLGHALRIDPLLLRVCAVVFVLAGGAGALLYAAGWLLLPEEGAGESIAARHLGRDRHRQAAPPAEHAVGGFGSPHRVSRPVLLVALVFAGLAVIVGGSVGWHQPWQPLLIGVAVVVGLLARSRQLAAGPSDATQQSAGASQGSPGPAGATAPPGPAGPPGAGAAGTGTATPVGGVGTAGPPAGGYSHRDLAPAPPEFWALPDPLGLHAGPTEVAAPATEPVAGPPPPPVDLDRRHRRRVSAVTLLLAAASAGVIGVVDAGLGGTLPAASYVAAPLGVVGLGLFAGARFGRPRLLVPVGILLTLALAVVGVTGDLIGLQQTVLRPTSVQSIPPAVDVDRGQVVIDLTRVAFGATPVRLDTSVGAGQLVVELPADTDVRLDAHLGFGQLSAFGRGDGGPGLSEKLTDLGPDGAGGGRLDLSAEVAVGQLVVRRGSS